ncbi:MAG TPA: pilus assembly protein PilM [Opitutus sp.]|nr:pilus assembly protein PilM [Opitutus sp.]
MRRVLLPPRVSVVDVGASRVAGGVFSTGASGLLVLQQFALAGHDADPAREARWDEDTAKALADAAGHLKGAGAATLGVPGHLALTKFVKTPAVEPAKRGRIIEFEASQNIPYPLEEIVWDHAVVAQDGVDMEVMLAAAKNDAMEALCGAAEAAGLPAARATPSCLALAHGFRFNHPEIDGSVLLVDIGARSTHLLFLETKRLFVRTLALAGNAVTAAIADELRLEFGAAEALKVQVLAGRTALLGDSPSRIAVQRAVDGFCTRLQAEINRSMVNYLRQTSGTAPAAIYLTGGGSLLPDLPVVLRDKLKASVERYDPLRRVQVAPAAAGATAVPAQLAALVGLASRAARKPDWDANLLPATRGEALAFRRREPILLAAAACVALALLAPIWRYQRAAARARATMAAIETQLRPVRLLQNRNADNLAKLETAKQRVAALEGLAESKSNWVNFLGDLQQRLAAVQDVWLEKLAVTRDAGGAGAAAGSGPAPIRLMLSGRLLDRNNPVSKVSADSYQRVKQLLASFGASEFVASVENERFDNSQPGILRFDFTLVVNPQQPL